MSIKTVIQLVNTRPYNNKTFYSFKGQDGTWYSTGTKQPPNKGSFVEFEAEPDAKGYLVAKDIVILPQTEQAVSTAPRVAAKAVQAAKSSNNSKDDYWERKETRDVEVQARIEIQSCRNSALQFIGQLIQVEAVPLPKGKAEREEFMVALLKRYTDFFVSQNRGETPEESAQPVEDNKQDVQDNNNEAANWS